MVEDLTTITWVATLGRWLAYVCTLWIGGTVLAELLLERADIDIRLLAERLAGPAIVATAGLLMLRIGLLWTQAWLLFALDEPVTLELVQVVVMRTNWGAGWRWQLAAAVTALIGFLLHRAGVPVGRFVAALGCIGASLSVPLTGHAVEQGWLNVAIGSQMLHVICATAWIGTLAVLAGRLLRPGAPVTDDDVARAIHEFSPFALTAATTLLLTGLTTAWLYVDELRTLWTTAYGRTLSLKILLFVATASVGYINWRHVRPRLGTADGTAVLRRSAAFELTWATALLLVTALLVALPMPMR